MKHGRGLALKQMSTRNRIHVDDLEFLFMTESTIRFSRDLRRARCRFYPGWWSYSRCDLQHQMKPMYFVTCQSPAEYRLAHEVKPSNVRATIVYRPKSFARRQNVTLESLMADLGVTETERQEWISLGRLRLRTTSPSERLSELQAKELIEAKVYQDAEAIFADPNAWLNSPNPRFGGASPREVMAAGNLRVVLEALEAIQHGIVT